MAIKYCSKCGKPNALDVRFCQHCGQALAELRDYTKTPPNIQASPSTSISRGSEIGQMGQGGMSIMDIWGPFAGYGDRGRHVSWLLDNLGYRADELREAVTRRFSERQIPGGHVRSKVLTGKGIAVERRPYHLIQRGVATVGLYIARFGQDLFISQVTYAKGAINPLRVLIMIFMILFQLYFMFGYSQSIESSLSSFNILSDYSQEIEELLNLLCCIGPLGLINTLGLTLAGIHMIYKFITVRDPFMLLRTPLNEFQTDDTVALEKAVEETVRQSLDKLGIDTGLMPPSPDNVATRRII